MPAYGQHLSAGDARQSMRLNVRCSFGDLGHVPAESISYAGWCFLPAQAASGEACTENTTVTCLVPSSVAPTRISIGISANGNDAQAGPHFVPVGWPDAAAGSFSYYTQPVASQLIPPGGPVLGATSITIQGEGFAGLGADVSQLRCAFSGAAGVAVSVSLSGDQIVCNSTAIGAGERYPRRLQPDFLCS